MERFQRHAWGARLASLIFLVGGLAACGGGDSGEQPLTNGDVAANASTETAASPAIANCGGIGKEDPSAPNSVLILRIAGSEAGVSHDNLRVQGRARLGGTLQVVFEDGYAPPKGQQYTLIEAECIEGGFASVSTNRGVSLTTQQAATTLKVIVQ